MPNLVLDIVTIGRKCLFQIKTGDWNVLLQLSVSQVSLLREASRTNKKVTSDDE